MQKPEDTIKFVKEYLADPSSKTLEEVQANYDATYAAAYAATYADADRYAYAAAAVDDAAYWVKRYEERKHRVAAWSRKG